jgi:hypothetical protein
MLVVRFFDFENFATYYSNLLKFPGRILSRARDDPFRGISLHGKLKRVRLQQMAFSKRKVASLANSGLKSVKDAPQTRKRKENNTVCKFF